MNRVLMKIPSFESLVVLYVILVSKSLYYDSFGENILLFPFLIILFIKAYVLKNDPVKMPVKSILYSLALLAIVVSNLDSQFSSISVLLLRLVISIIIVQLLDFKVFSVHFSNIIVSLGVISLLTFPVIYFNIPSVFPDVIGMDERVIRNFVFFGVWENFIQYDIYRNSGLWWEPGAFALFLNVSFIFDIVNRRITLIKYFIYFLITLTIYSTTGIVTFLLLSLLLIQRVRARQFLTFSLLVVPPLIFSFVFYFLPNILGKIVVGNDSFSSRYYDFLVSYEMFLDAPFLGYGFGSQLQNAIPFGINLLGEQVYESVHPTGADGLTMFIAQVGIAGFLFLIPFLVPKYACTLSFIERVIIFISLLLLFNAENFTFILIFTVLTFYGISGSKSMLYGKSIS